MTNAAREGTLAASAAATNNDAININLLLLAHEVHSQGADLAPRIRGTRKRVTESGGRAVPQRAVPARADRSVAHHSARDADQLEPSRLRKLCDDVAAVAVVVVVVEIESHGV